MHFISFSSSIVTNVNLVDIDLLKCHEEVVSHRLKSFIDYLTSLEGDIVIPSIVVCDKSMIIIDGHHRYHALKYFGLKEVPVTMVKYDSPDIKAYFDDRISKNQIIDSVNSGKLLPPKSSKHLIFDTESGSYLPILLLSSMWYYNL